MATCVVLLTSASASAAVSPGAPAGPLAQPQSIVSPAASNAQINRALTQHTGYDESQLTDESVCPQPANPGGVRCSAQVVVTRSGHTIIHPSPGPRRQPEPTSSSAQPGLQPPAGNGLSQPTPWTPAYLQEAYDLSWLSANRGTGDTVAIVDEGYDDTAPADLATFRTQNGLSSCPTTGVDPCFRQVNENGSSDVSQMPGTLVPGSDWQAETTLDIDAVSSICPNCNILLVEDSGSADSDWPIGEQTAATLGAEQISNSWTEGTDGTVPGGGTFTFPDVLTVASGGDQGFSGYSTSPTPSSYDEYPAALPGVLAAGGTTLATSGQVATGRGFGESVWNQDGAYQNDATTSGCDIYEAKPAYQTDVGCPGRAWDDLAADADPLTGLQIYDNGQWELYGGTSLSSPLIAAYAALIGQHSDSPAWTYADAADMFDVTTGNDETTSSASCLSQISYICTAGLGYDGPTGNGTMSGTAVTGGPGIGGPGYVNGSSYVASQSGTAISVDAGIYPNGLSTSYYWTYPGGQTTPINAGSGPGVVMTSTNLAGLPVSNGDSFHLVVTNADGTVDGYPQSVAISGGTPATAPVNNIAPQLDGAAVIGQTLTTSVGDWNPAPGSVAYQWQVSTDDSSWTDITGATGLTYQVPAGELGDYLRAQVTATNGVGSTTATAVQTARVTTLVPSLTGAPAVTGTALDGQTLTASTGQWDPTPNEGYAYQWQRSVDGSSWTNIQGASAATYTLTSADVADVVRVGVTAFDNNGAGEPSNSTPTGRIYSTPVNTSLPTISGTAQRLRTLTAAPGQWTSDEASVYHFQWQRSADGSNWSDIAGATDSTYTLAVADEDDRIRVQVSDTNPSVTTTALSAATTTVAANPPTAPANPTISGTPALGQLVTVTNAAFAPADVQVRYQWQRSADANSWTDIPDATTATYTPTAADIGEFIRAEVDYDNDDGSDPTDTGMVMIQALAVNTEAPQIIGAPQSGLTLTAVAGNWTGAGTVSDQWVRCPAASGTVTGSCQDVGTGGTYTPNDGDVGDRIAIVETDTNSSGTAVSDSALSAVVAVGPLAPADGSVAKKPTASAMAVTQIAKTGTRMLKTSAGKQYATAKLTAVKHTKKRKLVIARAAGITGPVTAWACQTTGKKRCLSKKTSHSSERWTTTLTGALRITATLD